MESRLHAALEAFDSDSLRGEAVVHAEQLLPLDQANDLWSRLDPTYPMSPLRTPPAVEERFELAAHLDGIMGDSAWGLPIDAVADAYVLAGEADRAFELRQRALARTPRWDSVLAARQLLRVANDLRARGHSEDARDLDERAARLDPTVRPGVVELGRVEPLDDDGLVDLFLADEYTSVLGDHLAKPRRFALASARRGAPEMGRLPLHVTRKWEPYISTPALRLGPDEAFESSDRNNARLLAAIEATPAGAQALALSRKKAPNPFNGNENNQIKHYKALAAEGDWAAVRRGLLSWERKCRLFVGALLTLDGDPLGTAYVERSAALASAISLDGYEQGDDWALPRKVLARRDGDTSSTWWCA